MYDAVTRLLIRIVSLEPDGIGMVLSHESYEVYAVKEEQ